MGGANWRDITKDAVAVRAAEVKRRGGGSALSATQRVGFSPRVIPYLVRAAQARGISLAGYIRRAVMAHVAMDLGLDPVDLFAQDLGIGPSGKGAATRLQSMDLDGKIYGQWKVQPDDSAADYS
jgi:hypothetical protein